MTSTEGTTSKHHASPSALWWPMSARFAVVDVSGSIVDLAAIVNAHAGALAVGDVETDDPFGHQLLEGGDLRLQATGVRVCMGFQPSASSHTGRDVEAEADGEVAG